MAPQPKTPLEKTIERINERLTTLGMSGNEASRRANIGVSYINDLRSGKSKNPSVINLTRLANVLDCDVEYLMGVQDELRRSKDSDASGSRTRPSMPLYTVTLTDPDGFFPMLDDETTEFSAVAGTEGASLYAITIGDDLMAPRFLAGEIVCANPKKPVSPGSFVVVRTNGDRAVIRRLATVSPDDIELVALKGEVRTHIPRSDIKAIHRITATFEG